MHRHLPAALPVTRNRVRRSKLRLSAAALGVLLIGASPAPADFASATSAYDGGDYATAFREWRRLAEAGDIESQIALAGLYRGGIGRGIDFTRAAHWYRRAAQSGHAVGQLNLAEMYEHGWGVPRDAIEAYVWYFRAARQGRSWAAEQRDRLANRFTAAQLATARKRLTKTK
jgi:TPR repeat protein